MTQGVDDSDAFPSESARTWLAHELHDGLMQWIVGAKLHAEAMLAKSRGGNAPSTEQVAYLVELLATASTEGRRMLAGLRPLELDNSNWHDAIQIWLQIASSGSSAIVTLDLTDEPADEPDTVQRTAYRIAQAAIGNALRHAGAKNIRVHAGIESGNLWLHIEDDGCGFDASQVSPERYGLKGIRERAALQGGSTEIRSRQNDGTEVKVVVPIKP